MTDLSSLLSDNWHLSPERFSGIAFLHKGNERILYLTKSSEVLLHYHSRHNEEAPVSYDWQELQEILSAAGRSYSKGVEGDVQE